jgi:hypothetical protein
MDDDKKTLESLTVTDAESYAQLESPDDEIEVVPMPSGARFRMRRADIQGMAMVGVLPQSLVNQGLAAWKKQGKVKTEQSKEDTMKEIESFIMDQPLEETAELLIFYRQIVVDNVLQPRVGYSESGVVSLLNSEGKPVAKVQERDFRYAFRWITRQEGKEAPGLSKFREGHERGTAAAGTDGAGLGDAAVIASESTQ